MSQAFIVISPFNFIVAGIFLGITWFVLFSGTRIK